MLQEIRSGGQSGVDISAVKTAKSLGFSYGGKMPKGYRTLAGPKPEYAILYNMKENYSPNYPPRTFENVKDTDATLRIASDFNSAGEKCTLNAIKKYNKLHFDVFVSDVNSFKLPESMHPKAAAEWIIRENIKVLNVAGNSEETSPGIGLFTERYISAMIGILREMSKHEHHS